MKRLPQSELELMMILWHSGKPLTRTEIEESLEGERRLSPTTVLSFLTRLQEKGFVEVSKQGKNNLYTPLIREQEYLKEESGNILQRLYRNSVKNFMTALYDGEHLSQKDLDELQEFLDEKRSGREKQDF